MENIFKNDIKEGNKIILEMSNTFSSPTKQKAMSQIIFQHTYPTFFKRESHSLISLLSFFISGKISENVIKLSVLLDTFANKHEIRFQKEKAIYVESRIVEMCGFNFNIIPVHMYVQSIAIDLELDYEDKMVIVDNIHSDNKVNYINYISGVYDPEQVAVSVFSDEEIDIFEIVYSKEVDRKMIKEIRKMLCNQT